MIEERVFLETPAPSDPNIRTQTYIWGRSFDNLLSMDKTDNNGTDRLFFHCNANFSIYAATDESGKVVERIQYDVFGRPDFQNPSGKSLDRDESIVDNPYLFQGRRWDAESRLYYYRNRYYDPGKGRFVTRDPMGIWYDDIQYGNGYSSFSLGPKKNFDPLGLKYLSKYFDVNVSIAKKQRPTCDTKGQLKLDAEINLNVFGIASFDSSGSLNIEIIPEKNIPKNKCSPPNYKPSITPIVDKTLSMTEISAKLGWKGKGGMYRFKYSAKFGATFNPESWWLRRGMGADIFGKGNLSVAADYRTWSEKCCTCFKTKATYKGSITPTVNAATLATAGLAVWGRVPKLLKAFGSTVIEKFGKAIPALRMLIP